MNARKTLKTVLVVFLVAVLGVSLFFALRGDDNDDPYVTEPTPAYETGQADEVGLLGEAEFDDFMDEFFSDWVTSSTLMINTFLVSPENMGIERPEPSFGAVPTLEQIRIEEQETREFIEHFAEFQFDLLRQDQQVIYEILERSIIIYEYGVRTEDSHFFTGFVRPVTGFQVSLPILLANFNFHTAYDIEQYLQLLPDITRFFDEVIEFERERAERGFFLSDANVDRVIEQLEEFLANRADCMLVAIIDERIGSFESLDAEQRETLKERHRLYVQEYFYPAYEALLLAMHELRGVGARVGGLASLPYGRDYALRALRMSVGTDRPPEELAEMLELWAEISFMNIIHIVQENVALGNRFFTNDTGRIELRTPEEYIEILQYAIAEDFPPIRPVNFVVNEVHESLREHASPAFFRLPPIDGYENNVIYINPAQLDDPLLLFTVLAHESYPGHLYQIVYFMQQSPHPIRMTLRNTGYVEGWATYTEMLSYYFAGLDEDEATLLWNWHLLANYLLPSRIDLGVNVFGWGSEEMAEFLAGFGLDDDDYIEAIYNSVTGNPLFTLDYALGFIELVEMRFEAENALGEYFQLIEFHRFFLDFGPAPFPIIRNHMDAWVEEWS